MDSQEGGARIQTYTDGYDTYCAISEHLWDLKLFKSKHLVQPGTCRLSSADMKVRKRDRERNVNMRGSRERGREKETEKEDILEVFNLLITVSIYSEVCHPHLLPCFWGPGEAIKKVRQGNIERTNRPRISAAAVLATKKWNRARAMLSQKMILDIHSGLQRRRRKVNVVARRGSATFSTNSSARATWNSSQGAF